LWEREGWKAGKALIGVQILELSVLRGVTRAKKSRKGGTLDRAGIEEAPKRKKKALIMV